MNSKLWKDNSNCYKSAEWGLIAQHPYTWYDLTKKVNDGFNNYARLGHF